MECCSNEPVIELYSGQKLCKRHFCVYFEKKVMRTTRRFKLLGKKEHIGVALSGGKDSLALLLSLKKLLGRNRGIRISAILIDEGIHSYREKTMKRAASLCKTLGIPLHVYSFQKEFHVKLDNIVAANNPNPCTECGILRRYLLNKAARKIKATKLATAHNLDDEAQSILMNQFRRNMALQARLGPLTGVTTSAKFIPRIKPFYLLLEKETALYAYLNGLYNEYETCPYAASSFRGIVRDKLNEIENIYLGTKNSIVASFLEIHPALQKRFKGKTIPTCEKCNEPSASNICNACRLISSITSKSRASS